MSDETTTFTGTDDVDVVGNANPVGITHDYNEAWKAWRRKENNPYAFQCVFHKGENTYIHGSGFHDPNPALEERRSSIRINIVIGMTILIFLLIENFFTLFVLAILHIFGANIGYNYSDHTIYGSQNFVLGLLIVQQLIQYLVPLLCLKIIFRLPNRVAAHMKIDNPRELPSFFGQLLMFFAIANFWLIFTSNKILNISTLGAAYNSISYMGIGHRIIYILFMLIVSSTMTEFLLHGQMFHVLRQYGDWYAIIFTAVMGACISHSLYTILLEFAIAILTGTIVFKSGSILPAIIGRMLYLLLTFIYYIITVEVGLPNNRFLQIIIMAFFFLGFFIFIIITNKYKSRPLVKQTHYLPLKDRFFTLFRFGPLLTVFILSLVLMAIEVVF